MPTVDLTAKEQLAVAARGLAADGLVHGTAGNLSRRDGERIAVTPTGAQLASLEPSDVVVVDPAGEVIEGALAPTSELDLHLALYRRYDCGAVVHTHAPIATALSLVIDELPLVHYEQLMLGGPVRVAPYATFGTPELATAAAEAIEGRSAALLANHGTISHGATLDDALRATRLLEWVSEVYWRAAAIGTPRSLDAEQALAVVEAATTRAYGQTRAIDAEAE
jgi:L-fuculose-phosphate aldolase